MSTFQMRMRATSSVIDGFELAGSVTVGGAPYLWSITKKRPCICGEQHVGKPDLLNNTNIVLRVATAGGPYFEVYDSGNGYVYVTGGGSGVSVVNGISDVGTVSVGNGPHWAAYDVETATSM